MSDSLAGCGTFLVGFHKAATSDHAKLNIAMPPVIRPELLASFNKPFNSKEYAVSLARHHPEFESNGCVAMNPVSAITHTKEQRAKCIYQMYRSADDKNIYAGSGVYCLSGLCPPFCATYTNVFASAFGNEFAVEEDIYVKPISAYEYANRLRLDRDLTYSLSHPENVCLIDCGIPKATSRLFLGAILDKLDAVNAENLEVSMPRQIAAPAATAMIPAFVNGAINLESQIIAFGQLHSQRIQ